MSGEARVPEQPGLNVGLPVRRVRIGDQVQPQPLRHVTVGQPQILKPLLVAVAVLAPRDHRASGVSSPAHGVAVPWRW